MVALVHENLYNFLGHAVVRVEVNVSRCADFDHLYRTTGLFLHHVEQQFSAHWIVFLHREKLGDERVFVVSPVADDALPHDHVLDALLPLM